jgi:hypothetical protein
MTSEEIRLYGSIAVMVLIYASLVFVLKGLDDE